MAPKEQSRFPKSEAARRPFAFLLAFAPKAEQALARAWRRLAPVSEYPLIALLSLIAYSNTLENRFTYDDVYIVARNDRIRSWSQFGDIFTTSYWNEPGQHGEYRPLTIFSYFLNYQIAAWTEGDALDPTHYHAVNWLLHALASALAAWCARVLFRRRALALCAGLVFALHPVHTEAVAGIVGRAEIMAAIGFFLALAFWRKSRDASTAKGVWAWAAAAALGAAFGVFSKENAIMIAAVAPLELALWRRMETRQGCAAPAWGALARKQAPAFVLIALVAAFYLAARYAVLGAVDRPAATTAAFIDNPAFNAPTAQRVATALRVQADYAWTILWPANLMADYSFDTLPLSKSFFELGPLMGIGVCLALAAAFAIGWIESPIVSFAVAVYALTIALTSNLFFPIGVIKAERLLYLPLFGFCLLAGLAFDALWGRAKGVEKKVALCLALAVVCGAGALRTYARNFVWRDDLSLFQSVLKQAPRNVKALCNYANALSAEKGQYDKALEMVNRALAAHPGDLYALTIQGTILANKAVALAKPANPMNTPEGRTLLAQAESSFRQALDANSQFAPARLYYGTLLYRTGRHGEALEQLRAGAALDGRDFAIRRQLGLTAWVAADKLARGDPEAKRALLEEAAAALEKSLEFVPFDYEARGKLGLAYYELGDYYNALLHLSHAHNIEYERRKTHNLELLLFIGGAQRYLGKYDEAQRTFALVLSIAPGNPQALQGLELVARDRAAKTTAPDAQE